MCLRRSHRFPLPGCTSRLETRSPVNRINTYWNKSVPATDSPDLGFAHLANTCCPHPEAAPCSWNSVSCLAPYDMVKISPLCSEIYPAGLFSGHCGGKRPRVTRFGHLFHVTYCTAQDKTFIAQKSSAVHNQWKQVCPAINDNHRTHLWDIKLATR